MIDSATEFEFERDGDAGVLWVDRTGTGFGLEGPGRLVDTPEGKELRIPVPKEAKPLVETLGEKVSVSITIRNRQN